MEKVERKIYCCANQIICALGNSTSQVLDAIEQYQSKKENYIDRTKLNFDGLSEYTFAEQLAILAIKDVIIQSKLELNSPRTALILSTTKGNIDTIKSDFQKSYLWEMKKRIEAYFNFKGTSLIISNACVSGVSSISIASRMIEQNEIDNAFIVGVDILGEFIISGFNSFKSVSPTACKPYDKNRDGLTPGEGCGVLLLSSNKELSNSKIIVAGYGISNDANHISGPSRTGDGLFFAIDKALKLAGLQASDIGLINGHGTGTVFNDEMESKAFALAEITSSPCNSLKPYLGHTFGAAGVIESILTIEQMKLSKVFGVKGYTECGVPYELNISAYHRDATINHSLKCASGFGGTNAAIILSKDSVSKSKNRNIQDYNIEKLSSISYHSNEDTNIADQLKADYKLLEDHNIKFYKMSSLAKAGYIASCRLLKDIQLDIPKDRIAIVLANRSSSLDTDLKHQEIVEANLPEGASPAVFVYTLANIVTSEIAIKHKFQGELTTFVSEHNSLDFLAGYAHKLINSDECDAVLYGWCEQLKEYFDVQLTIITKK